MDIDHGDAFCGIALMLIAVGVADIAYQIDMLRVVDFAAYLHAYGILVGVESNHDFIFAGTGEEGTPVAG